MRLALGPWGETVAELLDATKAAEAAGFECAWFPELHRTATIPTAAAAAATDTIALGTGIALAFVRSPLTIALSALDVDEIADGRFRLGLGTGVARLNENWHNTRFRSPARHLRETVAIVRRVIAGSHRGDTITFNGEEERIDLEGYRRPFTPLREQIPIYIGSMGPVVSRLAGEIADGWIALELGSPAYFRDQVHPHILSGLSKARRTPDDLDLVASACCIIHPDSHEAKRRMAGLVAFYASVRTYTSFFAWHGFEREALTIQELSRGGDTAGMIDACPDEMVSTFTFTGTPDEVRSQLAAYDGIVNSIKLSPPTHHVPPEVTREAQQAILDHFAN